MCELKPKSQFDINNVVLINMLECRLAMKVNVGMVRYNAQRERLFYG
jgi:hypothetical protein